MKRITALLLLLALGAAAFLAAAILWQARAPAGGPILPEPVDPRAIAGGPVAAVEDVSAAGGPRPNEAPARAPLAREEEPPRPAKSKGEEDAPPAGPLLRGRVVDAAGGPVADAEVEVGLPAQSGGMVAWSGSAPRAAKEARTGAGGGFAVAREGLDAKELAVRVRARGFLVLDASCAPDRDEGDAWLESFVLEPGVVIAGTVVDAGGAPVEGAWVERLTDEAGGLVRELVQRASGFRSSRSVETDGEGRFELVHEAAGEYELVVRHDDHPEGRFTGRTPHAGGELAGLVLRMPVAAEIRGLVRGFPADEERVVVRARRVDGADGEQSLLLDLTGVDGEKRGAVEPDGRFVVRGLEPGARYELTAVDPTGYLPMQATPCSEPVVAAGGDESVELVWSSGARVVFEVRDAATGELLDEVEVLHRFPDPKNPWLAQTSKETHTGGRVAIEGLRPDPAPAELEIAVRAPGRREELRTVPAVPAIGEVDLGAIRLQVAPRLRVRVVDASSGEPISKARVRLRPEDDSTEERARGAGFPLQAPSGRTDSDGWCALPACATPTATLEVRKVRYAELVREGVPMPVEGERDELVRLVAGGTVRVVVIDGTGRPVEGASVRRRDPSGEEEQRSTDEAGAVEFERLWPGEHAFRAQRRASGLFGAQVEVHQAEEGEPQAPWTTVQVLDGRASRVELVVPTSASLSGAVLARGLPVEGATVGLFAGEEGDARADFRAELMARMGGAAGPGAAQSAVTDARGAFRIEDVPAGRHRLRVTRSAGGVPHTRVLELREGENRVEVELPVAAIEGRVVDERGAPIAGASVRAVESETRESGGEKLQEMEVALGLFGGGPRGVETDAAGAFVIASVPPGRSVVLEVRARGFVPGRSETLELDEGETRRRVEVALGRGGSIRVQVRGGGPFAVVSAHYRGEGEGPKPPPAIELVKGSETVLEDLRPGTWRVELENEEGVSELVEVRAGEEALVLLRGE